MIKLNIKLVIAVIIIFGVTAFVSCEKNITESPQDEKELLKSQVILDASDYLDEEDVITLRNSLAFDDKGRVIGFDYGNIRDKLSEREYIEFLSIIVKSSRFEVDNKLVSISNNTNQNKRLKYATELEFDSGQRIYHDKRNWRRPGCRPRTGAICVIYVE